jgi:hypothetical protein
MKTPEESLRSEEMRLCLLEQLRATGTRPIAADALLRGLRLRGLATTTPAECQGELDTLCLLELASEGRAELAPDRKVYTLTPDGVRQLAKMQNP